MKRVIQNHNNKILKTNYTKDTPEKSCSCPSNRKNMCPLDNKCLKGSLIYKATVQKSGHYYIGIAETNFKDRYTKHKHSFKNENNKNATTLSQHIWSTNQNISPANPEPDVKWQIVTTAPSCRPTSSVCQLCLEEKLEILKHNKDPKCLNKRSELTSRCIIFHRTRHKLSNII